uniref:enoyl-CoA hydratase-related protein n=1 Tax=Roseivirga sp. TaxID=1964215 RepID=UPI00404706BA
SAYLAKMVGQKKAREIFFLGRNYSAQDAADMGMVNAVIPHAELEDTAYQWAQEILEKSPTSIKMLKFAMNLTDDGMVGQQVFAGEATMLKRRQPRKSQCPSKQEVGALVTDQREVDNTLQLIRLMAN